MLIDDELKKYKVKLQYKVKWGDMDAARHVNNLIYMGWTETVRIAYFDAIGIDTSFSGTAEGPILAWQDCKYIFPVTFPDDVIVGCRTIEIKEDRFILESAVFSVKHDRLAALSKQSIIPYSYAKFTKVAMPESWLNGIEKIDKISGL